MDKPTREQLLYDKFVDTLLAKLDNSEIAPKELEIVMKFIDSQGLQASDKHKGLSELTQKAMELPFDDDNEQPLRRIK